jgi:hypothetical protein
MGIKNNLKDRKTPKEISLMNIINPIHTDPVIKCVLLAA